MPDLGEHLLRELRLESEHEPRRRLARRVRDDVELDRDLFGGHAREGIRRARRDTIARVTGPALPVSLADIEAAARRLDGVAVRTPLLRLPLDGEVYVKPESLQRTGSFKFRGAFNALASTPFAADRARRRGGFERQSRPGRRRRRGAPRRAGDDRDARERGTGEGGAHGRLGRRDRALRELERRAPAVAAEIRDARSLEYIPPFDDVRIIAGQGTVGLEMARDAPRASRPSSSASAAAVSSRASRRPSRRSAPAHG